MPENTIEIKKSTGITISVAILAAIIVSVFAVGGWVTTVNATVERVETLQTSLQTLNENLQVTNENVVQLKAILTERTK